MNGADEPAQGMRTAIERSMIAVMPFPMLLVDAAGTIGALNPSASLLFGFDQDETATMSVGRLLPQLSRDIGDAAIGDYAGRHDGTRVAQSRVLIGCHRDGREMPLELVVGETALDGDRSYICLVRPAASTLPTERHPEFSSTSPSTAPPSPAQAQPDTRALTELVATTSNLVHELNQPLTAMNNYLAAAQIALVANAACDRVADFVADASAQSLRARTIVRRLREILAN